MSVYYRRGIGISTVHIHVEFNHCVAVKSIHIEEIFTDNFCKMKDTLSVKPNYEWNYEAKQTSYWVETKRAVYKHVKLQTEQQADQQQIISHAFVLFLLCKH